MQEMIRAVAARLRAAARVTVLTGAGVSAASGVPTFRGRDGLWRQFRPADLATPEAFARDPRLVWEWYAWRRERVAACEPNAAHAVLAGWTSRNEAWRIITQNVDDLHHRAGSRRVIRLHGSIWELSCWNQCAAAPATWRDERVPLPEIPARCPACGRLARPAVVWFGEPLQTAIIAAALDAAACDVFLTVGTSSVVYPAAGLVDTARAHGAFIVEINPEATPASDIASVTFRAVAEEVLPAIDRELR
jgi:NAD-dependent protein deacetylase/lipoamidase